jgi:ribonuclease D
MRSEPTELPLIDNAGALDDLLERISGETLVALDTEFVRERTYFPELCVLQVATEGTIAAVDCLAAIELDPLFATLLEPTKCWLLHSARQDLEVLFQRTGKLPARLIDTQIAAGLIGLPPQVGLQSLLEQVLGVRIEKEHTRANWSRRPLRQALLQYALDDVRYLIPAWRELQARLEAEGRASWLDEDCARQLALPIEPDSMALLERTKGAGTLKGKRRAAALALLEWRELRAKERDKPRRWILADDQLVRIANALPATPADLARIADLPPRLVARSGSVLLAAIRTSPPAQEAPEWHPPDKAAVGLLKAQIKARAEELGLQPELLATRRDIAMAASGRLPETLANGWRRTALAAILEKLSSDPAH